MNFLENILAEKKQEVEELKRKFSVSSFRDFEFYSQKTLSFTSSLKKEKAIAVIAEIKKASPSIGILKEDFNLNLTIDEVAEIATVLVGYFDLLVRINFENK